MDNPYLSLIIPSYNEEERIAKTLERVLEYLKNQDYTWEVLVVIDGAKDRTFNIVKGFEDESKGKLKVINNPKNHGKGYVVRQGMLEANGEYCVFTDSDNSTDIKYLESMLVKFKEGFDIVISTRDSKDAAGAGQEVPQSSFKRLLGNMGNIFIQVVAVRGIWDTQNGFKGFKANVAKDIFSRATIDRWGFDIEALALAKKLKYKIGIIPIMWRNDPNSHVKLSGYIEVLWETVKIRWNLITGKYDRK